MALDHSGPLYHSLPAIGVLGIIAVLFMGSAFYYGIIYPLRKDRLRRKQAFANQSASTSSISETHKRELHRWVPTPPTPSTPGLSLAAHEANDFVPTFHLQPRSSQEDSFYNPHRLDSPVDPSMLQIATPTLPPTAMSGERAMDWRYSQHSLEQVPDLSAPYDLIEEQRRERLPSPVAIPPAIASRTSTDAVSVTTSSTLPPSYRTTSSTLPPSYRTNRTTKRASQTVSQLPSFEESQYPPPSTSTQVLVRHTRRPGERRRSFDGGFRLEGAPLALPAVRNGRRGKAARAQGSGERS
ncbi:hypothetical protein BD309DRAFT_964863 [Dichomitus squalens]|uniref:Uncharacterized protein n=1 Tax=Dichomitus squalens TaxID=114155 RepID=A0A4Q9NP93_9APHY|nr:hypothetical protein BD309DRAFT_964863 [Dichomitus squalens]TBU55941.1 hypothetical protein BD310DRAFT_908053 [Dichomitus squalens]